MTKNTLLSTIAALTLFGATGIATAQSPGGNAASAPPAAAAPKEEMSKPPAAKPGPSAQDSKSAPKQAQDSKSSPQQAQDSKSAPKQAQDKPAAAKDKAATSPGGDKKASTTGAAPSGGAAAPPPEKQSQIASAIKQEKIKEVTNVNFNISIGARVPSTVQFYPIPTRIIEIYPEWRGYRVILVNGRYVIVRPNTYEIVYIIEG
ncbi:MAG: hypothetical protein QOD94_2749 [Alphaproteobacteria bacterium]|jgi:hypothetical protein|nr:hypothetical protein [Alphaproteobacteria bacterium]